MDWMVSTFGGTLFFGGRNDQEGMEGKSLHEMEFQISGIFAAAIEFHT